MSRASLRHGLPYGWWKNPDVWAATLVGIPALVMLLFILAVWWL